MERQTPASSVKHTPETAFNKFKQIMHRAHPRQQHETELQWAERLKKALQTATTKFTLKEAARVGLGSKTYKPNGAKECARRVRQLKAGAIRNYVHGAQYPKYY